MSVIENLLKVREQMSLHGIDAYIVLSEDPHCSEYPANHWKFREYLSGFNGSAGTLVITRDHVGLWTDSRYYLQAEKQLRDTGIELFRQGTENVPDFISYLTYVLPSGSVVGVDGLTLSKKMYDEIVATFTNFGLKINFRISIIDELFACREPMPINEISEVPLSHAGISRRDKFDIVMDIMNKKNVTHYIINALDDVAWLLNMRGSDVDYNPVFYSYMIVSSDGENIFIDPHKLTSEISRHLDDDGIKVSLYEHFELNLSNIPSGSRVYYDPSMANVSSIYALPDNVVKIEGPSIISQLKSCKNNVEIDGMCSSQLRDGVAMVKFLSWLDNNVGRSRITEMSAADKLLSFRKEFEQFLSESFETISAYNSNGAIVHYVPTIESNLELERSGLLLVDSGAQYVDGTTDITRTISLGNVSEKAKLDYTLVLKGHIQLTSAIFPRGTRGVQLDVFARMPMWRYFSDYGHGTGHGVGCNLSVHEGPQAIRKTDNGVAIDLNMITSNEPGLYRENEYGIRTENLMLAVKCDEDSSFMKFETITICPIDTRPIIVSMLTDEELNWINNYHKYVYQSLSSLLDESTKKWLQKATLPLTR